MNQQSGNNICSYYSAYIQQSIFMEEAYENWQLNAYQNSPNIDTKLVFH